MNHKSIILLSVLPFLIFLFLIPLAFKNRFKKNLEENLSPTLHPGCNYQMTSCHDKNNKTN